MRRTPLLGRADPAVRRQHPAALADSQYTLYVDGEWDALGGTLATRVDYRWTDDFYFDPSNIPECCRQPTNWSRLRLVEIAEQG